MKTMKLSFIAVSICMVLAGLFYFFSPIQEVQAKPPGCGAGTAAGTICCVVGGANDGLCLKSRGGGYFSYVYDGTADASSCTCNE